MSSYDHSQIEPAWQARWEKEGAFRTPTPSANKPKAYVLNMFPYPSGSGLHVGHLLGYTGSDLLARVARMQGKDVLYPMGWDAFGLPAENYAIKTGVHPGITTVDAVREFKRQFRQAGMSFDWEKEINTSQPEYYKWTQWFFTLMYKRDLAYRKQAMVNWCEHCQTVLANEQVVGGECERCGNKVIQRSMKQWYFKITDYADRLLEDLEELDWPEKIKAMQRNWIGKSKGAKLFFEVEGQAGVQIEVFTTRPDTLYGATYIVVAPEHSLVAGITAPEHLEAVTAYQKATTAKSELERTFLEKEKTGAFTGSLAVHPLTGDKLPIWIADYVVATYGTGAVMAVPAHDERDFAFATAFNLPIEQVLEAEDIPFYGKSKLINSGEFTGLTSEEAIPAITKAAKGELTTTYRLRDWLVSRQRFWGAPFPILYDEEGNETLLEGADLPVVLPEVAEFVPTGQSPLALMDDWKAVVKDGKTYTREVDTLDTFVCSSWYYLRYPNPHYSEGAFDPKAVAEWLPVDVYIGGAEHAVLHLLYARFVTKVLFDAGLVSFKEPFTSLRNQGMILGPDHNKMSKSKGNVINPDDVIKEYGGDTLRTYELFMGPFDQEKPWSTKGIVGVRRFLEKVWRLGEKASAAEAGTEELVAINRAIVKVSDAIADLRFNVAIAGLMEATNELGDQETITEATYRSLLKLLAPFAPHITDELWSSLGGEGFIMHASWPVADEKYLTASTVEYPVQVNGKVRLSVTVAAEADEVAIMAAVAAHELYGKWIGDQEIKRKVIVPGRLVSLVVG